MYATAVLAVLSAVAGLATLPMLWSALVRQHPGAAHAAISSAVATTVLVVLVRGLASGLMWLWSARAARRRRPQAPLLAAAAWAVTTLAVAGSFAGVLSTVADRAVGLAAWLAALATIVLAWRAGWFRRRAKAS
jgi:hypothetical protein